MKEQIKSPKIELSHEETANLSDTQFKTLVFRMLINMVEYGHKIEENIQGTNSDRKETRTQINNLEQKEEINIQAEQNEGTRIQKNEERLRNLWDKLMHSNIGIIGVQEGEEEEQNIENLLERLMK